MEAKQQDKTQSPVISSGRRRKKDPAENLLAHLSHDTGGVLKLLWFAVGSFLSFFGAVMTTMIPMNSQTRYLWLAFCLVTAAVSLVLMIKALSKPVEE
ncbi:MAG: hypothetical protein JO025_28145 [Verrucomicrobia bacterium]|nr:hypothetical protein [Verrucomicrobiota bacterium]